MKLSDEFDEWAAAGRDQGMEERHWHTAKHALEQIPLEEGDTVVDLGTGSGYALRALNDIGQLSSGIGIDAAREMVRNARGYTEDSTLAFLQGVFEHLPLESDAVDHVFSMEAFYYAQEPELVLEEVTRILRPGGTFHCAVNFFEESQYTHRWQDRIGVDMILWDRQTYREAFERAGLDVAMQRCIPDVEVDIPPEAAFPTGEWDTRDAMVDRYRRWGTLLTVGVA